MALGLFQTSAAIRMPFSRQSDTADTPSSNTSQPSRDSMKQFSPSLASAGSST